MSKLQYLYDKMPYAVQEWALSARSFLYQRHRRGRRYNAFIKQFMQLQWANRDDLNEFTRIEFCQVFSEAVAAIPYYKQLLSERGFDPKAFRNLNDIFNLPAIEKPMLRESPNRFINPKRKTIYTSKTGGTTGAPLLTPYDDESMQKSIAIQDHYFQMVGIRFGQPCLYLCGQPVVPHSEGREYCRIDRATNSLFASVHHLSSRTVENYLRAIEKFGPVWGMGYTSFAFELARYIIDRGEIGRIRLAGFMGTSETATPEMRTVIEKGFCTRLFDFYSSTEGIPFAGQCVAGNYHIHPASGIIEVVDTDGNAVPPGTPGELVVTSFKQLKRPLLRYAVKDTGVIAKNQECPCGLKWTVIEKLCGRMAEWVTNKDGKRISQFSHQVFKVTDHVKASQIEQLSKDSFTVRLVVDEIWRTKVQATVRGRFPAVLGHEADLKFEFVESLERTQGGKCPTVISHV